MDNIKGFILSSTESILNTMEEPTAPRNRTKHSKKPDVSHPSPSVFYCYMPCVMYNLHVFFFASVYVQVTAWPSTKDLCAQSKLNIYFPELNKFALQCSR